MIRHLTLAVALTTSLTFAGPLQETLSTAPGIWRPGDPISLAAGVVVVDVSARGRFEWRENTFDFNSATDTVNDDSFFLERVRFGLSIQPAAWFTLRAQAQDAREIGSNRANVPGQLGAEGDNPFDLRLLSIRLGDAASAPVTFEIGRQALDYGDQRLIGSFEWNNIGRVFDAAVLRWKNDAHRIDLFTASVVVPDRDGFDQSWLSGAEARQLLTGIYYRNDVLAGQTTDLYALWQSAGGGTDFATVGTRWISKPGILGGFDYGLEGALQFGEVGGNDLRAGAFRIGAGHTWDSAWTPRLGVAWDYGSGDRNPTDGKTRTFQNLYPTNHLFYGFMDVFSWQNINSPSLEFSVKPTGSLTLRAAWHIFWLSTTEDAWYRANGTTQVRPITPSASSYAGQELDLTLAWKTSKWSDLLVGYSHFFAGDYLEDTGAASDADFFYIQCALRF